MGVTDREEEEDETVCQKQACHVLQTLFYGMCKNVNNVKWGLTGVKSWQPGWNQKPVQLQLNLSNPQSRTTQKLHRQAASDRP